MQAFLLVSYSGLVWPTAADCALSGRLFRRRRPSHDPKAQSRHRRNDPSTYHIAVLTQFRRRPRQAPTGTGPLGTDTRLAAMIDGPRHRQWSYCPDTAAVYHPDRENSLPRFTVETVRARWFCTMAALVGLQSQCQIDMQCAHRVWAQAGSLRTGSRPFIGRRRRLAERSTFWRKAAGRGIRPLRVTPRAIT